MDSKRDGALTSGQLGAATGVSADTVRHYEKLGLLAKPLRTNGGYRLYPCDAMLRVQAIRTALEAGFSLTELAGIFRERDAGGTPCWRVAGMAKDKITALDRQIAELSELRDWLSTEVADWNKRLEQTPSGKRAGLLESLATNHPLKGLHPQNERNHFRIRSSPVSRRLRPDCNALSDARSKRL